VRAVTSGEGRSFDGVRAVTSGEGRSFDGGEGCDQWGGQECVPVMGVRAVTSGAGVCPSGGGWGGGD
jgi:hypothetical protein